MTAREPGKRSFLCSKETIDVYALRDLVGIVDREELHKLLRETGFEVRFEFGDYQFTEFHESDPLLVIEAVKRD